jgi:hypothetical protein
MSAKEENEAEGNGWASSPPLQPRLAMTLAGACDDGGVEDKAESEDEVNSSSLSQTDVTL